MKVSLVAFVCFLTVVVSKPLQDQDTDIWPAESLYRLGNMLNEDEVVPVSRRLREVFYHVNRYHSNLPSQNEQSLDLGMDIGDNLDIHERRNSLEENAPSVDVIYFP